MEVQIGPSGPYASKFTPPPTAPKKSRKKFWIVVGAFLAFVLLLFGYIFWQAFDLWLGQRRVERTAEAWRRAEQELYQKQLADTYGGKTPQETLRMYIEAVEANDYELASKYFVIEGQEKELRSFDNATTEDIKDYLIPLRTALHNGKGEFSLDRKYFSFDGPILISLTLYPNGIWKIVGI